MKILSNKKYNDLILKSCRGMFGAVTDDMLLRNCGAMQQEIDNYKNILVELEEYIKNHYIVGHTIQNSSLDGIINKLNELKEKYKC